MLDNGSWRPHAFQSESHIKLVKSQFFSLLVCEQDKAASQKSSVLHALVAMKGLSRGKKTSSKQHRWSVPWNYNPRHMKTSRWMDANTYTCIHTHTHTHTHSHTHTHPLSINISTKQILLWETRIANAVIKRMVSNISIPFNLKESVINMFHADNSEWLEDTPNGKKTSHLLQLSVFQSCNNEKCEPVVLTHT